MDWWVGGLVGGESLRIKELLLPICFLTLESVFYSFFYSTIFFTAMIFLKAIRTFELLCRAFSRSAKDQISEKKKEKMPQQAEPHQRVPQEEMLLSYPDGQARRALFCKCAICYSTGTPLCTA